MIPLPVRLHDRALSLIATVQIGRSADVARIFGAAGYDALVIDTEHAGLCAETVSDLCLAALDTGMVPLVRLPDHAAGPIRQALSFGALGVVIPRVETAAEAREIVRSARFPPDGVRPVPPVFPHARRHPVAQGDAVAALAQATTVVAIIETAAGVAAAAEIAAVRGIDVLFLGMSDLSFDIGADGDKDDARLWSAAGDVVAATRAEGRIAGIGGISAPEHFRRAIGMGFAYLSAANDATLLFEAAADKARHLRSAAAPKA